MVSVRDLPCINTIIEEALRMYPSTPSTLPRRTHSEGEIINGTFIPGNVRAIHVEMPTVFVY